MSTITHIIGTAIAAALAFGLAACSSDVTPEPVETSPVVTAIPAPDQTTDPAPVEETPAEPEIVADEYSQVVDGVLYQGTEKAPVRIGDDTPGIAPAIDAEIPDVTTSGTTWASDLQRAIDSGKYVVMISDGYKLGQRTGYSWTAYAVNEYGNIKGRDNVGLTKGEPFPTIEAAMASPFTVDGRTLDRAEYVVIQLFS